MTRWAGRYLKLESTEPELPAVQPVPPASAFRSPHAELDPQKRSRTLRHEHLTITGREVEVVEDEIGVAEMHWEQ